MLTRFDSALTWLTLAVVLLSRLLVLLAHNGRQGDLHKEDVERLNILKEEAKVAFREAGILTENELKEFDK